MTLTATDLFCGAGGSSLGARLAGVELVMAANHWQTAIDVHQAHFPDAGHALIYCDPPYLGAARADDGAAYVDELLSETAHRDLAEALHATPAAVILSGYPSDLYDSDLYADWYRAERTVTRRPSNRASGPMAHATEVLWSNRPLATQGTLRLDVG